VRRRRNSGVEFAHRIAGLLSTLARYHDPSRGIPEPEGARSRCDGINGQLVARLAEVAQMLKAIHAQEDRRSAEDKVREVIAKLRAVRLTKAAELVEAKAHETLTYFAFPSNHWRQVRTNNPLERINLPK